MNFLQALGSSALLQSALLGLIAASFASGVLGSYVVVKRIVSLSGSISHSVLGGLGCALWLQRACGIEWMDPIYGGLVAAIVSALLIGWVHVAMKEREDTVIAMIWSIGMAIGILFASQTPGYNVELMNYLLGNPLWISSREILLLLGLDLLILITVFRCHRRFLAICFDEKQAYLQGVPVRALYFLLLILIAISVVLLIHVMGTVLVVSMLALPPMIAEKFCGKLTTMMILSVGLNLLFSIGGLALSYRLNWPTGATIALLSGVIYLMSVRLRTWRTRRMSNRDPQSRLEMDA